MLSDAELIRGAQAGDRAALKALYERYLHTVWRYAYAHTNADGHAAEDIVSEVFLALVRKVAALDPKRGQLAGWLIGVARHKVIDRKRRRQRGPISLDSSDANSPASTEASPQTLVEQRELVARVMDQLADDERLALEWKYLEELSVREMAARMGRTEKAVESILFRARRSFRAMVAQSGGTEQCRPAT